MREATVKAQAVTCPQCGGTVQLRGFGYTLSVTCAQCGCLLNTSEGAAAVLAKAQQAQTVQPEIPLGSRGRFDGTDYEVIGFQQRFTPGYGRNYYWNEYVLFHPYKGFRYLSSYEGHWNLISPVQGLPYSTGNLKVYNQGTFGLFRLFLVSPAKTSYVLGEFPWRVRTGEEVTLEDSIAPPYTLSSETKQNETTWSLAQYVSGDDVWKAFKLAGKAPRAKGVYANEPNPWAAKRGTYLKTCVTFAILATAMLIFFLFGTEPKRLFANDYVFHPTVGEETSIVTPEFTVSGSHTTMVKINTRAEVDQNWVYLWISLINKDTNESFDSGRTLSHYSGVEDGEAWEEGDLAHSESIYRVAPGHYYLRIEPERDLEPGETFEEAKRPVSFHVMVEQGGVNYWNYGLAIALLVLPAIYVFLRHHFFEQKRWAESNFGEAALGNRTAGGDE